TRFSRDWSSDVCSSDLRVRQTDIFAAREAVMGLYMAEPVEEYIVQLIMATREPGRYDQRLAAWIQYGSSPRGTIALDRCARAHRSEGRRGGQACRPPRL